MKGRGIGYHKLDLNLSLLGTARGFFIHLLRIYILNPNQMSAIVAGPRATSMDKVSQQSSHRGNWEKDNMLNRVIPFFLPSLHNLRTIPQYKRLKAHRCYLEHYL